MVSAAGYVNTPTGGSWSDFSMCSINCHAVGGTYPYVAPMSYTNDY